jgi:hypothetical protein
VTDEVRAWLVFGALAAVLLGCLLTAAYALVMNYRRRK